MAIDYTGTDSAFRDEVRDSLAGISSNMLPDDTIDQKRDWVEAWADDRIDQSDYPDDDIDDAIVAYTAELSYKAIPAKSTISAGGVSANMAVRQYRDDLEQESSKMLGRVGLFHPQEGGTAPLAKRTDGIFDNLR